MARVFDGKARRWQTAITFEFTGVVGEECYVSVLHDNGFQVQAVGSSPSNALANLINHDSARLDKAVLFAGLREMEPVVCDEEGNLRAKETLAKTIEVMHGGHVPGH